MNYKLNDGTLNDDLSAETQNEGNVEVLARTELLVGDEAQANVEVGYVQSELAQDETEKGLGPMAHAMDYATMEHAVEYAMAHYVVSKQPLILQDVDSINTRSRNCSSLLAYERLSDLRP